MKLTLHTSKVLDKAMWNTPEEGTTFYHHRYKNDDFTMYTNKEQVYNDLVKHLGAIDGVKNVLAKELESPNWVSELNSRKGCDASIF